MENGQINDSLTDACFEELVKLTHKLTGITIGSDRKSMLVSRLRRRVRAQGLTDFDSYVRFVSEDRDEAQQFVNSVTTNETYFYRTPRVWDFITGDFLEKWIGDGIKRPLRAWSAASSTGEEAHTMGVFFQDLKDRHTAFNYEILATDISSRVVNVAKEGTYSGRSIERFRTAKPDLFERYMTTEDDCNYQARSDIRQSISFQAHNLFKPLRTAHKFDIIFIRNVLIYFTKKDQEIVLSNIDRALGDEGVLVIGESESLAQVNTNFQSVVPLVYRRKS